MSPITFVVPLAHLPSEPGTCVSACWSQCLCVKWEDLKSGVLAQAFGSRAAQFAKRLWISHIFL